MITNLKKTVVLLPFISLFISCSDSEDADNFDASLYLKVPDAQFEAKLIALGIDSEGKLDSKVLKADVENVAELEISSASTSEEIHDLTGIEGFTKLKKLVAIGNRLSTIDLTHNTLLDTLDLSGNDLSSIDLSKNKDLLMVDLKVNDLSSISGLSNAVNLKWLNLSFNFFEEFTIENPTLANILMSHNELVSIDTSQASGLESLYLVTNQITDLDLSANTILETVDVGDNKLTQINFGSKANLIYLSCFSNLLENLDVSGFDKLDYLSANRNPDLHCIQVETGQDIPTLKLSDYQQVNANCN
ncbi:leucine-rich repeat domain-containing protein [Flagellimonas myxillae]|uniref:leucine-rich repeat domain-containing protein n=1 Tax=Flagellimonas myxillae TaxID=2942214 RepID=UPI00201F5582|nr:hypothetical protein [Muricauda myxillae]MCL6265991.1 hypothetical protein [Muricauda myxillae]